MKAKLVVERALDMFAEELNLYFMDDWEIVPSSIVDEVTVSIISIGGYPTICLTCIHEHVYADSLKLQMMVNSVKEKDQLNALRKLTDELNRYKTLFQSSS